MLDWWKVHHLHFPTVGHMARDFLCIPTSSVSVKRLFSRCKLTISGVRSSMSFETARRRICCQHWMKAGVDAGTVRTPPQVDKGID
ncbi:HAT dimerization protein [Rhizoctonia solani AG-3 Rhs1AP]|nr:HAT dimerization protein [Rhizoctonia solani AG-3 Rhs1AP]